MQCIHFLISGPWIGCRRIYPLVDKFKFLCFSSFYSVTARTKENCRRASDGNSCGSAVAFSGLVPVISTSSNISFVNSFTQSIFALFAFQEQPSGMEVDFSGGRESIRKAFEYRLILASAISTMLASISESTIKQYARLFRLWWNFCQRRHLSVFSPSASQALDFLAQEFQNISSYSSLNTMRSAISLISDNEIGQHPAVRRFCREAVERLLSRRSNPRGRNMISSGIWLP